MIMSVKEKIDTIDFIISVLMEHEKKLDNLIERMERNTEMMESIIKKEKLSNVVRT